MQNFFNDAHAAFFIGSYIGILVVDFLIFLLYFKNNRRAVRSKKQHANFYNWVLVLNFCSFALLGVLFAMSEIANVVAVVMLAGLAGISGIFLCWFVWDAARLLCRKRRKQLRKKRI